ncbi:AsmA-like C-terminal region-containing protein [Eisenibacter elegans]|uniref:DUF748 domain-containing protein n=1 Tax=Eisenibacter elegans TaxID=997 RepID=UPI0004073F66|nr:AsmA-like C-terminal region-containing protein [Eisenibacter elegans]
MAFSLQKSLRRLALTLIGIFLLLLLVASVVLYVYKESIANRLADELEQYLSSEFSVGRVDFSFFRTPARLTLTFQNFKVLGAHPRNKQLLLSAERVHFTLHITNVLRRNYQVERLEVENGDLYLTTDARGAANFADALRWPTNKAGGQAASIQALQLKNVHIRYQNRQRNEQIHSLVGAATISLGHNKAGKIAYRIQASTQTLSVEAAKQTLLQYDRLVWDMEGTLDLNSFQVLLTKGEVSYKQSTLAYSGVLRFAQHGRTEVNLVFQSPKSDLQALIALLPLEYYEQLIDYKAEGEVYLKGAAKGMWSAQSSPAINFEFGCDNVVIRSPNINQSIQNMSFKGVFSNGSAQSLATTSLRIQPLTGRLDNRKFSLELYVLNFADPFLELQLDAGLNMAALTEFFAFDHIRQADGLVGLSLSLNGQLSQLRKAQNPQNINLSGKIDLNKVSFQWKNYPAPFRQLQGTLTLDKNTLQVEGLSGFIGRSSLNIRQLQLIDLPAYLLAQQPLRFRGQLKAGLLDFEELLHKESFSANADLTNLQSHPYLFVLPPRWTGSLRIEADTLRFAGFRGQGFSADLALRDQVLRSGNVSMRLADGPVGGLFVLNAQQPHWIRLDSRWQLNEVPADQLLRMFNNFGQQSIQYTQLRGQLQADVQLSLVLDKYLRIQWPQVVADAALRLRNGRFVNFDPIRRIVNSLSTRKIKLNPELPFQELRHILQIRNQTIFIPELEIISPEATLSILGYATPDSKIDYRIRLPMPQERRGAFAALSPEEFRKTNFYLSAQGVTLGDFKAGFVEFGSAQQLDQQWKREKQILLNLFDKMALETKPFRLDTLTAPLLD